MLVGCVVLYSGGNYKMFDTTFTYSWAQIKLPDGTIIEGKVDNWTDYEILDTSKGEKLERCKSRLMAPHI